MNFPDPIPHQAVHQPAERRDPDPNVPEPVLLTRILNAHADDIHGMIRMNDDLFVTCSKDGSTRVWTFEGTAFTPQKRRGIDYRKWITALSPHSSPEYFLSGSRDGLISLMDKNTNPVWQGQYSSQQPVVGCKERNHSRITCITNLNENQFFFGTLGLFIRYDIGTNAPITHCRTSDRDWVYCIHPFTESKTLVVTGTELEMWEHLEGEAKWQRLAVIQSQWFARVRGPQRPFISALTQLSGNPAFFGMSVFDGSIRISDIERNREVQRFQEHVGRTWTVVNMSPTEIATCADDATVKLWDIRLKNSVLTLGGFPGRVSCLLPLKNRQLITAACPNDSHASQTKAEIVFWDFRRPVDRQPIAPLVPIEEEKDNLGQLGAKFSYLTVAKEASKERK